MVYTTQYTPAQNINIDGYFNVCILLINVDDQFKRLLNQILSLKYEVRSYNEKLDIFIWTSENNVGTQNESVFYDTFQIDNILPIESQEKLNEIEEEIARDKIFRNKMVYI